MSASSALRERQAEATRDHILDAAYDLLVNHPGAPFSHEAIAAKARLGARTIYRYFPAQADLFQHLWLRLRTDSGTIFPASEDEILSQVPILFGGFDRNESLIRAVLESPAGHQVREQGAPEGRAAFNKSLAHSTSGLTATERRRITAVFLAMYSAPFWQLLRERGALSGPDAIAATQWAMGVLLDHVRNTSRKQRKFKGNNP